MRILILGGDGYLGWPTAMHFAARGHEVRVMDNYLRRQIALATNSQPLVNPPSLDDRAALFSAHCGCDIKVIIGDCRDYDLMISVFNDFAPEAVVHYAEQPSAPYSMADYRSARLTLENNLSATFNLIWAVKEAAPQCHIVKLGTMGEYGTPNIDIEEGWLTVEHKGRRETFLYPRQGSSLYHTTKILDTDLLWFYVRTYDLQVTDLMQGPVYGLRTPEADLDQVLAPIFNYDDLFGTVVNRFVTQAVAGIPLTVYGQGGQTRGYLNLLDTLQCVDLAVMNPPGAGKLRVLNQFTEQFTVLELANRVQVAGKNLGLKVKIRSIDNPRLEAENHYYNASRSGLMDLGLHPHYLTDEVLTDMLETVGKHKDRIDAGKMMPRVRWRH